MLFLPHSHPRRWLIFFSCLLFTVKMLRNAGRFSSHNGRPVYLLAFIILALLWIWKLNASTIIISPNLQIARFEPRLNTSWHRQITRELVATDESGLTGVETPLGVLDRTRVAVLIEDRPLPYLIPLLLHFISVVPPEWSFRFMGSEDSIKMMESNPTIRRYLEGNKLFLDLIPYHLVPSVNVSTTSFPIMNCDAFFFFFLINDHARSLRQFVLANCISYIQILG